jgi:pyruvate carboxylase
MSVSRRGEDSTTSTGKIAVGTPETHFKKVLVANRSEIAIRVFRAATELGLRTVAIYAQEDRLSVHRFKADEAYPVGEGKGPVGAYLDIAGIVALAKEKGVDMIHPGYGFLSENAAFARACREAGIAFVGPRADLLELMGDKVGARALAAKLGIPTLPGTKEPVEERAEAVKAAHDIGFPLIIKAAFGGGGRGMRVAAGRLSWRIFWTKRATKPGTPLATPLSF